MTQGKILKAIKFLIGGQEKRGREEENGRLVPCRSFRETTISLGVKHLEKKPG